MKDLLHDKRVYYSPIEFAMAYIGGTWKLPIIQSLRNGPVRYGDLKKRIPHISDKMLIEQLRELEEKKMIKRLRYIEKPPRVEYALEIRAKQALPLIDMLNTYGHYLMKEENID